MDNRAINVYVYNKKLQLVAIVDRYLSLTWSDRYDEPGDFELEFIYEPEIMKTIQQNYFLCIDFSDRWMIIEKIETNRDDDGSRKIIASGRSVECMLEWRVIPVVKRCYKHHWDDEYQKYINDGPMNMQEALKSIFEENFISPKDEDRSIPFIIFQESDEKDITEIEVNEEFYGENVLEIVQNWTQDNHFGFKMILNDDQKFVFTMYIGKDRTIDTNITEYVIFSPYYDTLKSSEYYSSTDKFRNVMYVNKSNDNAMLVSNKIIDDKYPAGFDRREVFINQSDLKKDDNKDLEGEDRLTDERIKTRGARKLDFEYKNEIGFEVEIIPETMYHYRKDFNVGDKVQLEDYYGNFERVHISEVVISFSEEGLQIVPTFKQIDWDDEKEKYYT